MTRPAFCIVETQPVYCQITDGIIGSSSRIVRYCETEAYAAKLAGKLHREEYEGFGDGSFYARPTTDPWSHYWHSAPQAAADDEIPF